MQVQIPEEALVIRFRPTDPDRVLASAAKEYRRTGHYRLSVFAGAPAPGEDEAMLQDRLLRAAELDGIDLAKQPKYFVCTQAGMLLKGGFTFWKYDDDPSEPPDHYSVDLGEEPALRDVTRFLEPFRSAPMRRPS
jgi:hypothetical protein